MPASSYTPRNDPFDGFMLVDKPAGWTSHDVVDKVRRHFHFRKVGHGGTLDPQATGLLVLLLGRGTRASDYLMTADKTYEGAMRLGITTDSQDADGKTIAEADPSGITPAQLEAATHKYIGDFYQTPPMVSAIKQNGVPLYKLARRGEEVPREPRLVHVYEFRLLQIALPSASFVLRCTKGTYVRTVCHDLGQDLGCGAHLANLRRTVVGPFTIEKAKTLDALLAMNASELLSSVILLHDLPSLRPMPQTS
ncbi:MAG: tRNA pseudouridine(55) synthase TruB [bacterium]